MATPGATEAVAVAVFAKAPIEGYAKSRLASALGAAGAAAVQRRLVERAVGVAVSAGIGPVSLWCAPDRRHECFAAAAARHPIELCDQGDGDLGERMAHAFETLARHRPGIVMGSDCPALTARHLADCADALRHGADAVFLPAEDGGYVLAGLRRPQRTLFVGVPWGTAQVMEETRQRARAANLRVVEPAVLWDVDDAAGYARAREAGLI